MWSFGRKLGLSFLLSFLVLVLVGVLSVRGVGILMRTSYAVTHTHAVLDQVSRVLGAAKDAETGQRGFVLTGSDAYLEPFNAAKASLPSILSGLRKLIAENPQQLDRLGNAERRITAIMSLFQTRIAQRRSGGEAVAVEAMRTGDDKRQMDELRSLLREMSDRENELLLERAQEVEVAGSGVRTAISIGTIAGLAIVCGAGLVLARTLRTQIGAAVSHVQRSSAELQSASTQLAVGARQTASSMAEITTTLAELSRSSKEIAETVLQVAGIAGKTADAASTANAELQTSREAMDAMQRQSAEVVNHMVDLSRKSRQIDGVLDLVVELAEQTNILAINATIEAVGAGENGVRFSVVADQVRKLADRTTDSTKEIRRQIESIRDAVNASMMATETGSKAVLSGVQRFGLVTSSLDGIGAMVVRTNQATREIGLATKQQATAVEQLNQALAQTADAAKENEASSAQTSQTASTLAEMSMNLMRLVQAPSAR